MSLNRRLYFSLISFIIIPLTIIGIIIYLVIGLLNRTERYEQELISFKNSTQDIEDIIQYTENIKHSAVTANPLFRLIDNTADSKDYYDISNYFDDLLQRYPYYENFTISLNNDIIYQRGTFISEESEEYLTLAHTETSKEYWASAHALITPKTNTSRTSSNIITYYSSIHDFYHGANQTIGVLAINIDEHILSSTYTTRLNPQSTDSLILKPDGTILSSSNKDSLGSTSVLFLDIKNQLVNPSGYLTLTQSNEVCYYYKGPSSDFMYLNIVPNSAYSEFESAYAIVLFIALIICIIFGICFSLIQKRYIINPIRQLMTEVTKMRDGDFTLDLPYQSNDEIGRLNQEVIHTSDRINNLINEVYLGKIKQQEAELIALVTQINPHFLYNTLDSIHWLAITEGAYDTSEQIEALSSIFRHTLNKGNDFVSIESEIKFIEHYMFLMGKRYGKRIQLHIDVPPHLMDKIILKLLLQPLIENSILHGLEPQKNGGYINLSIYTDDSYLYINVADNGVGVDESIIQSKLRSDHKTDSVFALKNIDERIHLHYGETYGLSFHSQLGVGTTVCLTLPYEN